MSRYSAIKAATNAYIKTNGRQEITGAILNAVMIATIDSLGKFYQFVGRAVPATDPGNIDQNVAYLASTPGTYEHLGGFTLVEGEVAVIKFAGEWAKETICTIPSNVSDLTNDAGFITRAVADLINYYDKDDINEFFDSFSRQSYVVAWDGSAAPVVSQIPQGVSVTYGGDTYAGTLPASESTLGKIYLVSDGAGYDQYITTSDPTYSWIPLGTTSIDLSGYATQAEVDTMKDDEELDALALGRNVTTDTIPITTSIAGVAYKINESTKEWEATVGDERFVLYPIEPGKKYTIHGRSNRDSVISVLAESAPGNVGDEAVFATGFDSVLPLPANQEYSFVAPPDAVSIYYWKYDTSSQYRFPTSIDIESVDFDVLKPSDTEDNLESTSATDPLSANQGRILGGEVFGKRETDPTITDLTSSLAPFTSGKGIDYQTGNVYNSSNYDASSYVDISGYDLIIYSRAETTSSTTGLGVAFYDSAKHFISGQQAKKVSVADGYVETTLVVPENAVYFRLSQNKNTGTWGYAYLRGGVRTFVPYSKIQELQDQVAVLNSEADNTIRLDQRDIVERNVIDSNGDYSSADGYGCTDFIPCHGAGRLTYTKVVGTFGAGLAFYDQDKALISYVDSISGSNGMTEVTIDIPDNAYYFRASGWNYVNSTIYGSFYAYLSGNEVCLRGKRASNGEPTYFSVVYNSAIDDMTTDTFSVPSQGESPVCTTAVVLLPPSYTMDGKPSRVIINFHGWSHYVHYKQWGAAGSNYAGFMQQKYRWANAGYVVIDINHKNSGQGADYSGLGSKQDDECYHRAWEWVREHYNVEDTCFLVSGSAGGINGINACYTWSEARAAVWLDNWIDVSQHPYPSSCGQYYYGYSGSYDASKVGTRNPMLRIKNVGGSDFLQMPPCPVKIYYLTKTAGFMKPFVDIINAGRAVGDFQVRKCTGITHSVLVSGGDGTDPQAAVVDAEIIRWLDQH